MGWGQKAIEGNWPRVQRLFAEQLGPAALSIVNDDRTMRKALKEVHKKLPFSVRLVVRQGTFIRICTKNKHRLLSSLGR